MDDVLGEAFRILMQLGGGSDILPLLAFCVVLILASLGIGLGVMRLLGRMRGARPDEPAEAPH